jgi:hypothetical protein
LVRHGGGVAIVDAFTARSSPAAELDFRPIEAAGSFTVYCSHLEARPLDAARDFMALLHCLLRPTGIALGYAPYSSLSLCSGHSGGDNSHDEVDKSSKLARLE